MSVISPSANSTRNPHEVRTGSHAANVPNLKGSAPSTGAFTILIDGLCPLCKREAAFMARLDGGRGRLNIVDIAAADFDPAAYGRTMDQVMGEINGVAPDGRLLTGMEVFRRAYAAVGWGWLLAPTAWPIIRPITDAFYRWFARNRYRLTLRKDAAACADGRCRIPAKD